MPIGWILSKALSGLMVLNPSDRASQPASQPINLVPEPS